MLRRLRSELTGSTVANRRIVPVQIAALSLISPGATICRTRTQSGCDYTAGFRGNL